MADCLFCRIARKQLPATIVHESDRVLAFRDIVPKAPVHVLIIPKEHIASLMHLEPRHAELLGEIHAAVQAVAKATSSHETGFRMIVNNGKDSGQAVDHLHYHVLAGRTLAWPPG